MVVGDDLTLAGPVQCPTHPLAPAAIEVVGADVTLDCANNSVRGASSGTGVLIAADGVTVRRCDVSLFDDGIATDGYRSDALVDTNTVYTTTRGIALERNTIGGSPALQALCDVGTYTVVP